MNIHLLVFQLITFRPYMMRPRHRKSQLTSKTASHVKNGDSKRDVGPEWIPASSGPEVSGLPPLERKHKTTPKHHRKAQKESDHDGDRTHNLLIRSQTPCHWATRPLDWLIIWLSVAAEVSRPNEGFEGGMWEKRVSGRTKIYANPLEEA
ncbi:hypothetical protein B0J15DRAFT_21863 [Fusarium solani]|uniref:Uncharacterized protein n=1 Tax=Fusarium solani TaxID=169388 RepID=A0A9P9L7K4_FUSSL|nr:uncharacterized protein B0J15DRAFT_21863 [Fusarium solani]KAH7275671.1 hypothetical protein B0J15DRAFT_21863 [Fusarium solani]